MDKRAKDFGNVKSSSKVKPLLSVGSEKIQLNGEIEGDEEKVSLLPPRRGGMSKSPGKPRLKVQWNDKDGSKLLPSLFEFPGQYTRHSNPFSFSFFTTSTTFLPSFSNQNPH